MSSAQKLVDALRAKRLEDLQSGRFKAGTGSVAWGAITGSIADQPDLQAALSSGGAGSGIFDLDDGTASAGGVFEFDEGGA
jgi:hypothetical protein